MQVCGSLGWSLCLLGPPTGYEMFALFWNLMNMSHSSSESIGPMYVEVSGWSARNVPGGRDFLWFRPSLDSEYLQAQWNNGRQHPLKLKLLLVLEQSLILRLGGSGVASMFALCRYLVHSILLYPYVLRVSWLIPICSGWWGLFHISSLVLSGWRTEQPSLEYFPIFPVQVHSRNIS